MAQSRHETRDVPSPEEFALQDLVPGQQAVAQSGSNFDPKDPLGLNNLPDATNLEALAKAHVPLSLVARGGAVAVNSGRRHGRQLVPSRKTAARRRSRGRARFRWRAAQSERHLRQLTQPQSRKRWRAADQM